MPGFWENKRVCVTGGAGFLGRAVCAKLLADGADDPFVPRSHTYDLTTPEAVARLFDDVDPDIVIHLAAEVGGIGINQKRPGRFFFANMAMGIHLIEESRKRGVQKFVQVGSVCAYPKHCPRPFREDDLWTGYPDETNAPYGVAKRSLGVMLDAYRSEYGFNGIYVIPVNMFGPFDDFGPETSHVIAAMIRKFCDAVDCGAACVECWGTGDVTREFLYVLDAADGVVAAATLHNDSQPINLGTGQDVTIAELAETIARLTGYSGSIEWNRKLPGGQPKRQLDTTRAATLLGWQATVTLEQGLKRTIDWWRKNRSRFDDEKRCEIVDAGQTGAGAPSRTGAPS